ncbi:MAG: inositol monophosphatase family protein [Anaerolineales bacterium]
MSVPKLADLEYLAKEAGKILHASYEPLPGCANHLDIQYKGVIDLVTDVDRRSEEFLLKEIRGAFPSHHIVAEESGGQSGNLQHVWYIDPLDGTVNYAHGIPIFSVSIAYQEAGELVLGVVYDPMREECFSAELGKGAWMNGSPIQPSHATELDHSLFVTGFPYDIRTTSETNLDHYARLSILSQGVRRLGSAALDSSYVACGRFDGYWEMELSPWDVAAGGLIARQAGALVTNLRGQNDFLSQPQSIIVAPRTIHAQLLDYFRQYVRE